MVSLGNFGGYFHGGGDEEGGSALLFPRVSRGRTVHEGFVIDFVVVLGNSVEVSVEANELHDLALRVLSQVNF